MSGSPRIDCDVVSIRVAVRADTPYMGLMSNDNATHPYKLEIIPAAKPAGHFEWTIRKHDKLVERSDRAHASERSALERGQAALERQIKGER